MATSIGLALVAFGLALGFGPRWLLFVRSRQMGKQLNPSEPEEHAAKQGTPTMGGVIWLTPVIAVTLAFQVFNGGRLIMLIPVLLAAGLAVLGGVDDLQTLVGRERSAGLSPTAKWAIQIVLAAGASVGLWLTGVAQVHVPFAGVFVLPAIAYVPFATFVLLCTINGVGISDGLDSLAATTAVAAFVAFWVIGTILGYPLSAGLCATVVGALLGYLWFNAHPAQIFMGDVGSLALGGLLGVAALIEREPLLLLPVGIIFVAEVLSDLLQVASNKLTGKRMFRFAPIHSHFRRSDKGDRWVSWPRNEWPETWVVQRFWIVGSIGALLGILAAVKG